MGAIVIILICSLFIYRQAYNSGRDPMRWIIGGIGIFFVIQIFVYVAFRLVILFFQSSPETLDLLSKNTIIVDIISLVLSSCGLLLLMWQVSQKPDNSPDPNAERPL